MRMRLKVVFACAFMLLGASPAFSNELYYVELGSKPTAAEAEQRWQELVDAHTALLGDLEYRARGVFKSRKKVETRIQAGPLEDKKSAQKICRALFKHDIACFVVEGEMVVARNDNTAQAPLPWLTQEAAAPAAPVVETAAEEKKDEGVFAWLFGREEETPATAAPEPETLSEARVQVAEAIRVPLTSATNNATADGTSVPIVDAPVAVASSNIAPLDAQGQAKTDKPGWLIINRFEDENAASEHWRQVRAAIPDRAAGLRVKIARNLSSRASGVSLNLGPFGSEQDALEFCRNGVVAINAGLNCRFSARAVAEDKASERSERYRARKEAAMRYTYWAQIASAREHINAIQAWDALKKRYPDIVGDMRGSVVAVDDAEAGYAVRLGPMESQDAAMAFCQRLRDQHLECAVFRGN